MGQGLQVWDASGHLIVDTGDHLGRILGIQTITAGVDGSVTNSKFAEGDVFWQVTTLATYPTFQPTISFNAGTNTLSWAWEGRSGQNCKIIYGCY